MWSSAQQQEHQITANKFGLINQGTRKRGIKKERECDLK